MRRALVTGAHGLLGRWLVEALLARDVGVTVLARTPGRVSALVLDGLEARCAVVPGTLEEPAALARAAEGCDTVFHLAARSVVGGASPGAVVQTNVVGTWTLLEACDAVERVVLASSAKVYGRRGAPWSEHDPVAATEPYAVSKACAELLAGAWAAAAPGRSAAAARLANVYGPGDLEASRLVPAVVGDVLAGRPPGLHSDGSPVRDLVHAGDAAAALVALAEARADGPVNVGGEQPRAVGEVAALVAELGGVAWSAPAAPSEHDREAVATARLRELTGWAPRTGLRAGLEASLAWQRAHGAVPG